MLVPGEGPGVETSRWTQAQAPADARNSDGYHLVDAEQLRETYRKRAIAKLRRLRAADKLKFGGKFEYLRSRENWDVFVKNLESTDWVAYIQPPPNETSRANEVVNYLTRYLTGGPISNHCIIAADRQEVTFMAREGKRVGGERQQVPIKVQIGDFVRRWCLHIQPGQLTKTRYFGGWSNQLCADYMARCREALSSSDRLTKDHASEEEPVIGDTDDSTLECPHCGGDQLKLISQTPRPSWKDLFWREDDRCPPWYAELQREEHRRLWTEANGEDYYDWYLETQVEGAKESEPAPPPPIQLYLPGMTPQRSFEIESF
jgi:hypothetical protein